MLHLNVMLSVSTEVLSIKFGFEKMQQQWNRKSTSVVAPVSFDVQCTGTDFVKWDDVIDLKLLLPSSQPVVLNIGMSGKHAAAALTELALLAKSHPHRGGGGEPLPPPPSTSCGLNGGCCPTVPGPR